MPETWISTPEGAKKVSDMWIGTDAGPKQVSKAWVGGATGVPLLVFDRVRVTTTLTATVTGTSTATLTWTPSDGCQYQLWRTAGPQAVGPITVVTSSLSYQETGLLPSSTYSWRVDVLRDGQVVGSAAAAATTQAITLQQKTVTLQAVSSATYNGGGGNRGVAELYYGQYSGTHGQQRSLWCFAVPADVRGCASVDRIDIAIRNKHHFLGSGGQAYLVVHHGAYQGGMPATFPGSTGICQYNGSNWAMGAPKPGWMSAGNQSGDGVWMQHVQGLTTPGRSTLGEEFRAGGAQGLGLVAATSAQSGYGYADGAGTPNPPRMRITYTVRTG